MLTGYQGWGVTKAPLGLMLGPPSSTKVPFVRFNPAHISPEAVPLSMKSANAETGIGINSRP